MLPPPSGVVNLLPWCRHQPGVVSRNAIARLRQSTIAVRVSPPVDRWQRRCLGQAHHLCPGGFESFAALRLARGLGGKGAGANPSREGGVIENSAVLSRFVDRRLEEVPSLRSSAGHRGGPHAEYSRRHQEARDATGAGMHSSVAYRPVHVGLRFSTNALAPSTRSSVVRRSVERSFSRRTPSAKGSPSPPTTASLA